MTEAKLEKLQIEIPQTMISKKLLRLVVVLFNLKQGMLPTEIREQLNLEKMTDKTDDLCGESCMGRSDLEQSKL
jgi:hypothetical protein